MPPIAAEAIGALVRAGLLALAGYIVAQGWWSESDAGRYVEAATVAIVGLGWSLYQKHHSRLKLLTALTLPKNSTEVQVNKAVAEGEAPPVMTPPDTAPVATK